MSIGCRDNSLGESSERYWLSIVGYAVDRSTARQERKE